MSGSLESDTLSQREFRGDRLTLIVCMTALVVITAVVFQYSPSFGISELTGLALVWVVLGYAAFFAGSQAYAGRGGPRAYLTVGRGIPAWAFFVVGSTILLGTAVAWVAATAYRSGLLMAGIAIMYGSIAFPRPLSIRRASLSGIGLLISGIGLVFF